MLDSIFKKTDYTSIYGAIMQFDKNKKVPIHGWYPFVEGYSKEFILSIVDELDRKPECCLDPFSGSGTTSLELQNIGIKCYSFEVSPFMHELSRVKLIKDYTVKSFDNNINLLKYHIMHAPIEIENYVNFPKNKNYIEKPGLEKWHYDFSVMRGILDIKYAISQIKNNKYKSLFRIALASILLSVSNMYRNGKCISYKRKTYDKTKLSRENVHNIFIDRLITIFRDDIVYLNKIKDNKNKISNYNSCFLGDSRKLINTLQNNSIDLVITSPPYLNSRDYTDSYIDELRVIGYLDNIKSEMQYRSNTLRSHVQVKWEKTLPLDIKPLKESYNAILEHKDSFWNSSIPDMIAGYFCDIDRLFNNLYSKLITGGKIYFNVGNSAYYGIEIKVDEIVSLIAEKNGFEILEIREARKMKTSSQQKDKLPYLMESVIVMKK